MNVEIFHGGDKINMPNEDHYILVTLTDEKDDDFVEMYSLTREEFVKVIKDYAKWRVDNINYLPPMDKGSSQ